MRQRQLFDIGIIKPARNVIKYISGIFKRSREEPVSENDLARLLSGEEAWSGLEINRQTALSISAVWACVRVLSETLASLPLHLYRRLEKGKERATDHPLYDVLLRKPNEEQTAFQYRELLEAHLVLQGNAYSQIVTNGQGQVKNLWPLDPEKMTPRRSGGRIIYEYIKNDRKHILTSGEVFHIPGLGYDGIQGYSVLHMFKQAFGSARAGERFGAEFFKNFAQPKGVIKMPGKLRDDAVRKRMSASWQEQHGDWGRKHGPAILEEGAEWQSTSIPPDDAQFLTTRKFSITDIARIFRTQPHLIGDLEHATYTNIEHQGIEFVVHTMRPWFVRWEQAIGRQLLSEADQREYFAEFLIDALLRGDSAARWSAYRTAREIGVLSANDIRAMENLNPVEGGDQYFVPMNWVPADEVGEEPPPAQEPGEVPEEDSIREQRVQRAAMSRFKIADSFRPLFADAASRILSKEIRELKKGAKKHLIRSLEDFDLFLDQIYRELPPYMRRTMTPAYHSLVTQIKAEVGDEIDVDAKLSPEDEVFIRDFLTGYISRHIGASRKGIRTAVDRAVDTGVDFLEELDKKFDYWEKNRPANIAGAETVRGSNAFARHAYLLAGVIKLRWAALGPKTCPFCQGMDGTVVGIEQDFAMAGDLLEQADPGLPIQSPTKYPPLHGGCVCQIVSG